MLIQQISVFLENKAGRLATVASALGKQGIDIRAMSISDTTDFGILRLIVSDPAKAEACLKQEGWVVRVTDVIALELDDQPGGLAQVLSFLENGDMEIDYMYAFARGMLGKAVVVVKVSDHPRAIEWLKQHGVSMVDAERIYKGW